MHCPNCGAENDDGNRFCVGCGSSLSKRSSSAASPSASLKERVGHLFGTTRKARLLTVGTALAIVVAIVAFIALKPSNESDQDAYLQGVDRMCVGEKERISTLEQETLLQRPPNVGEFASVLVTIVAEWQSTVRATPPPPVHKEGVEAFNSALREVLIDAGSLARAIREGRPAAVIGAQAGSIDAATTGVDQAAENLGLSDCQDLQVAPAATTGP
jgi:zinc-ribbon domain